eukprot:gene5070-7075_t
MTDIARWGYNIEQLDELDDWSSEWSACKLNGGVWGGRRRGGRGIRTTNGRIPDISVEGVTLEFVGNRLLQNSSLKFLKGHIYGLVGSNGVGKSTLLRRMARGSIPGLASYFRIVYLQQELPNIPNHTVESFIRNGILEFDGISPMSDLEKEKAIKSLTDEEEKLQSLLDTLVEKGGCSDEIEKVSDRLCHIADELDQLTNNEDEENNSKKKIDSVSIETNTIEWSPKELKILKGLGLKSRLPLLMSQLSGGWRLRASLALSLILSLNADVLLLDEATNHLDLTSIAWLENYLKENMENNIVIAVSHDRSFLDHICTNIAEIKDQSLHYYPGNYSDFLSHLNELENYTNNKLDAQNRKEAQIKQSIEQIKSNNETSNQSVSNRVKKLERASMHRALDGKKFKNFSLKDLSEKSFRVATKLESIKHEKQISFKFHKTDLLYLRLAHLNMNIITLNDCEIVRINNNIITNNNINNNNNNNNNNTIIKKSSKVSNGQSNSIEIPQVILSKVSLEITPLSRIAIIGNNGQGKSTLLNAILSLTAQNQPQSTADQSSIVRITGQYWMHHNLIISMMSQHSIDAMEQYLNVNSIVYMTKQYELLQTNTNNHKIGNFEISELEVRALLGKFQLSGDLALKPIGMLSGGQKTRLAYAALCINKPHLLILDEPTNNLSIDAIEGLIQACQAFEVVDKHTVKSIKCNENSKNNNSTNDSMVAGSSKGINEENFNDIIEKCVVIRITRRSVKSSLLVSHNNKKLARLLNP